MTLRLSHFVSEQAGAQFPGYMLPTLDGRHIRITARGFELLKGKDFVYVSSDANDLYEPSLTLVKLPSGGPSSSPHM